MKINSDLYTELKTLSEKFKHYSDFGNTVDPWEVCNRDAWDRAARMLDALLNKYKEIG